MTALRRWLADTGTTQAELARAVGVGQSAVSRIAAGVELPNPATAAALAKATRGKVTVCELLGISPKLCGCGK